MVKIWRNNNTGKAYYMTGFRLSGDCMKSTMIDYEDYCHKYSMENNEFRRTHTPEEIE